MTNLVNLTDMELVELHEKDAYQPDTPQEGSREIDITAETIDRLKKQEREAEMYPPAFYPR